MTDESERERFEKWALLVLFSAEFPIGKFWHRDHYSHILTQGAWVSWKESRQSTASGIVRKLRDVQRSHRFEDWSGDSALGELAAEIASEHGLTE